MQPRFRLFDALDSIRRDLTHALRSLAKDRGFTLICVISLGIGIGAMVALTTFTRVITAPARGINTNGLAEVLVLPQGPLRIKAGVWALEQWSYPDYQALRDADTGMDITGWVQESDVFGEPDPERAGSPRVSVLYVSPNYFHTFGVSLARGAGFDSAIDDKPSGEARVILSDDFWKSRMNADPEILGKALAINGLPHTVIGVAPEDFRGHFHAFQSPSSLVFIPLERHPRLRENASIRDDRAVDWIRIYGRLKPGVDIERANALVTAAAAGLAERYPRTNEFKSATVQPYASMGAAGKPESTRVISVLLSLAGTVLLIVCLNISGMMLVRGATRERELSIRAALGASRQRLIRHLFFEALVLAFAGGAISAFVLFGVPAIIGWKLGVPIPEEIDLDAANVAIALGLCLVVSMLFGLLPAIRFSRPTLLPALKDDVGAGGRQTIRIHRIAAMVQIGIAVPFLVVAGVMIDRARTAEFGFPTDGLAAARLPLPEGSEREAAFAVRRVRDNLKQASGVRSVAVAGGMPIDFDYREFRIATANDTAFATAHVTHVAENFLETVGARLLRGRTITADDRIAAAAVAVVSQPLAELLFPGKEPIGERVKVTLDEGREQEFTIVGVTADFATSQLTTIRPQILLPLPETLPRTVFLIARGAPGDEPKLKAALETALRELGVEALPGVAFPGIVTGQDMLDKSIGDLIAEGTAVGVAGGAVLVLAALGIIGVVAFMVTTRTRELALRMALGATRLRVFRLMLSDVVRLVIPGVIGGLMLGAILIRTMQDVMGTPLTVGTTPLGFMEPVIYAGASAIAVSVALLAGLPAARRATTVPPMVAIRSEYPAAFGIEGHGIWFTIRRVTGAGLRRSVCGIALAALGGAAALPAQTPEDRIVITEHQITVDGRPLRYTARAGQLAIRDNETGEAHGRMFFVAYTQARRPNEPARPLTFLWNGGPGSSSSLVHLLGFGPRRISANGAPIDNQGTWLSFSDLVFVDPIGTGYSRPTKAEYGPEFYQTRGDAESVAEFIRVYRNQFEAWDAPVVLAGESYGVTRAAEVADVLLRRRIPVSRAILIGLALPLGQLSAVDRTALNVPTYTAAAFANKALASDLQGDLTTTLRKAEAWAVDRYAPALARRDQLSESERRDLTAELARFTGFSAALIDQKTLAIPMTQFSEQLLSDRKLMVGRYDSRLTAPFDPAQVKMYDPTRDPSLRDIIDDVAVVRYLRSELKYESDLLYQGPFGGGYPPPTSFRGDWMSVRWNRSPVNTPPAPAAADDQPLRRAMTGNPQLRVMSSCGYFDLVCSYFANTQTAVRLDPALAARVEVRNYGGGHAIYTDDRVRMELKRDVARFVLDLKGEPPRERAAMPYHARAGVLPIRVNDTGDVHGDVFYVSYSLDPKPGQLKRPLMFLWNGGPGSNSALLHLTGFGPKRLKLCECDIEDNDATWLPEADLVFVDPIGTGFSRPARAEYGAEFYSTLGDIASIAEFIRVYLTRFDAWDAPLYLAGESYGSWRAAGVAEALEQRGTRVAGVLLISGGVPIGPVIDEELRAALFIPTRAAAAFHHRRLPPDLQADLPSTLRLAERWARTEYAPALKRLATLSDQERDAIVTQLSRFTGLDRSLIDRQSLLVGRQQFAEGLLRDRKQVLARFDTRTFAGPPSVESRRAATINRYLRSDLKYQTDLAYLDAEVGYTPSGQRPLSVGARWSYDQAPADAVAPRLQNLDGPPGGSQPWIRRAMQINPALKVFVAAGLYDSLNSCAVNDALVPALEPALGANITAKCYEGGHAMYEEPRVRSEMTRDVAAFLRRP